MSYPQLFSSRDNRKSLVNFSEMVRFHHYPCGLVNYLSIDDLGESLGNVPGLLKTRLEMDQKSVEDALETIDHFQEVSDTI